MNKHHYLNILFFTILVVITLGEKIKQEDSLLLTSLFLLLYNHNILSKGIIEFSTPTINSNFQTDITTFENINKAVQQLYSKENTLEISGDKSVESIKCKSIKMNSLGSSFSLPAGKILQLHTNKANFGDIDVMSTVRCNHANVWNIISAEKIDTTRLEGPRNSDFVDSGGSGVRILNNVIFKDRVRMSHVESIENSSTVTGGIKEDCNGRFWSHNKNDQFKVKDDVPCNGWMI